MMHALISMKDVILGNIVVFNNWIHCNQTLLEYCALEQSESTRILVEYRDGTRTLAQALW